MSRGSTGESTVLDLSSLYGYSRIVYTFTSYSIYKTYSNQYYKHYELYPQMIYSTTRMRMTKNLFCQNF